MTTLTCKDFAAILQRPEIADRYIRSVFLGTQHGLPLEEKQDHYGIHYLWLQFDAEHAEKNKYPILYRCDIMGNTRPEPQ